MTPVFQTRYGKGDGNCLNACVASLLDLPLSQVPDFCIDGEWFDRLYNFCNERGLSLMYFPHMENCPVFLSGTHIILLLRLEGEDIFHAVVGKIVPDGRAPGTDAEIERLAAFSELAGYKKGDIIWRWKTELIHNPNCKGHPDIVGPAGYIIIANPL